MTVAAVVLAAGGGTRFAAEGGAGHKLLAEVGGQAVVDRAVASAAAAELDEVIVVHGAIDLSTRFALTVTVVPSEHWEDGLASSLAVAVRHADAVGHDAVVVGLGDQPGITPAAWRAVADAVTPAGIAVATYDGKRGHPVGIGRALWPDLPTTGDEGARQLLRDRVSLVVEVPCTGDPHDIDTPEDLDRWS